MRETCPTRRRAVGTLLAGSVAWICPSGSAQQDAGAAATPERPPAESCTTFCLDALFGTRYAYTLTLRSLTGSYDADDESALLRAILSMSASGLEDRGDWSATLASLWAAIELVAPHERSGPWTPISVDREICRFDEVRRQRSLLSGGPDYILGTDDFALHYIPADARVLARPRDRRVRIDDLRQILAPFPEEPPTATGGPSWLSRVEWQVARSSAPDGSTRVLLRSPDGVDGVQDSRFEVLFSDARGAMLPLALCSSVPGRNTTLLAVEYERVEGETESVGLFPKRVLRLQTSGAKVDLAEYTIRFDGAPAEESEAGLPLEPGTRLLVLPDGLPRGWTEGLRGDAPDTWPPELRRVMVLPGTDASGGDRR